MLHRSDIGKLKVSTSERNGLVSKNPLIPSTKIERSRNTEYSQLDNLEIYASCVKPVIDETDKEDVVYCV